MPNIAEVNRTRDRIASDRPTSTVAEERALKAGDAGTAYEGNLATIAVPIGLLAASVDQWVHVARGKQRVLAIRAVWSVVGGAAAAVKFRKITDTSAPGAAASATVVELATAAFDLTTTINTLNTATLSATAADLLLADGDKIAADFSGTLTGLVGLATIYLQKVP